MSTDLSKYTDEELLLIYKNQGENNDFLSSENESYSEGETYNVYVEYSEGGCFITSAVCRTFGKPDDCPELTAFREFRDTYMSQDVDMLADIKRYYEIAPKICSIIESKGAEYAKQEYAYIWDTYLTAAYEALNQGDLKLAYETYKNMVIAMENKYLVA